MPALPSIDAVPGTQQVAARVRLSAIPDDKPMLRAAAELTRDIARARPEIYWPDMLGSAFVGYAALAGAILVDNVWLALALGVLSVLTLYRALLFIHEISTCIATRCLVSARHGTRWWACRC